MNFQSQLQETVDQLTKDIDQLKDNMALKEDVVMMDPDKPLYFVWMSIYNTPLYHLIKSTQDPEEAYEMLQSKRGGFVTIGMACVPEAVATPA